MSVATPLFFEPVTAVAGTVVVLETAMAHQPQTQVAMIHMSYIPDIHLTLLIHNKMLLTVKQLRLAELNLLMIGHCKLI